MQLYLAYEMLKQVQHDSSYLTKNGTISYSAVFCFKQKL